MSFFRPLRANKAKKRWLKSVRENVRAGQCNLAIRSAVAAAKQGATKSELSAVMKTLRRCTCRVKGKK